MGTGGAVVIIMAANFLSTDDPKPVQRAVVSGFFSNAARLHYTGCYR